MSNFMNNHRSQYNNQNNRFNNNQNNRQNILPIVSKLVKNNNIHFKQNKLNQEIISNIISDDFKYPNLINKLIEVDKILLSYKRPLQNNRQKYICEKIDNHISIVEQHNITKHTRILDIGGGNGNVLSYFGNIYNIPKENLICLEYRDNIANGSFIYEFNAPNVTYVFWDELDKIMNLGSFDYIICMVSLHHMPDAFIHTKVLSLIQSSMNQNGTLLIKEHDASSSDIKTINWEHHLYHILETMEPLTLESAQQYLINYVNNFKSKYAFKQLFEANDFTLYKTFNNVFEPVDESFINDTVTKLYWQMFAYNK